VAAPPAAGSVSGETRAGADQAAEINEVNVGDAAASGGDQPVVTAAERARRSSSIAMVLPAHLLFATPAVDPQTPG
jgi:hypothetical protein